jgi:non-heme chloroperoxidase
VINQKNRWIYGAALGLLLAVSSLKGLAETARSEWVVINKSTRIHYLDAGRHSEAPTLVLIPGWRLPANIWKLQVEYFSTSWHVIALDPRSQGESTKTTEGNTPEVRAQDLQHLILQLGLSRVILVGWSQGVQDVAAYVDQFGLDKVAGLVFVDATVSAGPQEIQIHPELSQMILGMAAALASNPDKFSQEFVPQMFKKPQDAVFVRQLVKDSLKTPTDTAISMLMMDTFAVDRRPVLAKITRPTLIICTKDNTLPDARAEMYSHIAKSRLVLMEGVGHALFVDDPAKFNGILTDFFKTLE